MTKRIVVGGIVAGFIMFIWGAVSHMVLGLGEYGIKPIPGESVVLGTLKGQLKEPGFYFFPGLDNSPGLTKEQKAAAAKAWSEKFLAGPRGLIVYHPDGSQPITPGQLVTQLLSEIAAALVAAFVLAQAVALRSYIARVVLVAGMGLIPFFMVHLPYWNWYGFPADFTIAQLIDRLVAFLIAGLVLAKIVKAPIESPAPVAAAVAA